MALLASIILTGIAIALLAVYGADVMVANSTDSEYGFLPFDHQARGMGLGLPALILPFVAYVISRSEPSKMLGGMIIVSGILIIIGGFAVITVSDAAEPDIEAETISEATGEMIAEASADTIETTIDLAAALPLMIPGAIQMGIGALKIVRS